MQDKHPNRSSRIEEKRIYRSDGVADIHTDGNDLTQMATSDVLCERCERLDYSCWTDPDTYEYETYLLEDLGVMDSWKVDECNLCSFFYRSLPAKHRHRGNMRRVWGLFSFDRTSLLDSTWLNGGATLLCLMPLKGQNIEATYRDTLPDCLFTLRPKGECTMPVDTSMSSIDYESAKSWLKVCSNTHLKDCFSEKTTFDELRVIDCFRGEVVPIPTTKEYVTLSYVWGMAIASTVTQPSKEDPPCNKLPIVLPRTIHDAMVATVNLGYRYLWIDQYCMPQEEQECQKHIHQMDSIYRNSSLTIIAAAGENSHYGLPGVSHVQYYPPSIQIGQCVLASTNYHFDIQGEVESSVWRSRGWTYQEGLLPKRRLIFTDKRVYYECQRMCCETVSKMPRNFLPGQNTDQRWCRYCETFNCNHLHMLFDPSSQSAIRMDGRRRLFAPNGVGTDSLDVLSRVTEYSSRSLSYDNDILNGIMGILRTFENRSICVRHLWGLPFPGSTTGSAISSQNTYDGNHDPVPSLLYSLGWDLDYPSPRRHGFPSWSWTGWHGKVDWPVKCDTRLKSFEDNKIIQVQVELVSTHVLSFGRFQQSYDIMPVSSLSTIIHVKAQVSKIGLEHSGVFYFDVAEQVHVMKTQVTTAESLLSTETLLAMHISQYQVADSLEKINMFLIIRDTGICWDRVASGYYVLEIGEKDDVPREVMDIRLG